MYNGNIAQAQWRTSSTDNTLKSYGYTYDALNRITSALDNSGNYDVSNITYDKMGNLLTLTRDGWQDNGGTITYPDMDILDYDYGAGNKLTKVSDTGNGNYGFRDGTNTNDDFVYDANGNMTSDQNKGITGITYNHLNLPTSINIDGGNISYIYDATGMKLKKQTSTGTVTEYAGNYIYEGNNTSTSLQFLSHPEGYVNANGGGYDYVYQYRDHLDNVRLSYTDDPSNPGTPTIIEENNYYPFGGRHSGYNNGGDTALGNDLAQMWKFGGKELDESLGLETYDFGARNYDPWIGRWMNLDPLAEQMRRHSPYNYAFDNPIYFQDPDGMMPCPNGDCEDGVLDRARQGYKKLTTALSNLFAEAGNIGREKDLNSGDGNKIEAAKNERSKVVSKSLDEVGEGSKEIAKGVTMAVAEKTDEVAGDVSMTANAFTVGTGGVSGPLTIPVAKVADGVSAGTKVVKAGVHLSDGNTEAAAGELGEAAVDVALGKVGEKVIKQVDKVGGNLTKQQKDVHQSTFSIFLNLMKNSFLMSL